jgi:hypothetical protein
MVAMAGLGISGSAWCAGPGAGPAPGSRALPHSGQNIAGSRIEAPHDLQRCEISGCIKVFSISDFQIANLKTAGHLSWVQFFPSCHQHNRRITQGTDKKRKSQIGN